MSDNRPYKTLPTARYVRYLGIIIVDQRFTCSPQLRNKRIPQNDRFRLLRFSNRNKLPT